MRSVRTLSRTRERVILRVDMNVPFDAKGHILDDFRIRSALPTIRLIISRGASLMILAHRGKPNGPDPKLSIRPIARHLESLIGEHVEIVRDPIRMDPKDFEKNRVVMAENIRFFRGEQSRSRRFAESLRRWGRYYVNDAFGVSHRMDTSVTLLPRMCSSFAGLLFEKEVRELRSVMKHPKRPFIVLMGGGPANIETKAAYIQRFLAKADLVLLGGALFNTILAAGGRSVGKSFVARASFPVARMIKGKRVLFPSDVRTFSAMKPNAKVSVRNVGEIPAREFVVDIGPESIRAFSQMVRRAGTVLWNGPLGYIELPQSAAGTKTVAKALLRSRAKSIIGGGDLTGFLESRKIKGSRMYFSTGGGALLEFVAKGTLPGIEALK